MFSFFRKKKQFFSQEDNHLIVKAIRQAEKSTSGEVRVFVESRCSWMNAMDRAAEIFYLLKMEQTEQRNAVLVYIAMKDHQLAVFGDEGIHHLTKLFSADKAYEKIILHIYAAYFSLFICTT